METSEIIIYQTPDGQTSVEVKLEDESLWLTQNQMQNLFHQTKQNISLHINNIFKEKELDKNATVKQSLTVQKEGKRSVKRKIEYYSLDVIISVGYRVKSITGTKFRIWANKVLKEYLLKGYVINEKRLLTQGQQLEELKNTVKLLGKVIENKDINSEEAIGLLKVLTEYTYALEILDKYDHQILELGPVNKNDLFQINYAEAKQAIKTLKSKFGGSSLFGNEKDMSFKSSLAAIYQTFGSKYLYPSIEE